MSRRARDLLRRRSWLHWYGHRMGFEAYVMFEARIQYDAAELIGAGL